MKFRAQMAGKALVGDREPVRDLGLDSTPPAHRTILQSWSIFSQGVTVLRIALVLFTLYAKLKIFTWVDEFRQRETPG